jgi:hypothetical protein
MGLSQVARAALLSLTLHTAAPGHTEPSSCRTSHVHLGEHPTLAQLPWSREVQGISHDARHWFLATASELFRVPASTDLAGDFDGNPAVRRAPIPEALVARGFDHFGDFSWYDSEGTGVLCVPVERNAPGAELAFFRGSDLVFLGSARLPGSPRSAPFCAIDGVGHLVLGRRLTPTLARYRVDWSRVVAGQAVALEPVAGILLRDETGAALALDDLQGAAFSEDGRLLYLLTGYLDDHTCGPWAELWNGGCSLDPSLGGIHVFEVRGDRGGPCDSGEACEARRIDKSTNTAGDTAAPFSFAYAYRGTLRDAEEPEGITVWDLEAPGAPLAPRVRGQVHALMLDNELLDRWDRVSLRHYRAEVRCGGEEPVPASVP